MDNPQRGFKKKKKKKKKSKSKLFNYAKGWHV